MEPTPVEMQSFMTVESVFVRAQLKGEPLQKLLYIWVVKMLITHVFSAVSEADWDGAISKWSAAKPASPALKAKAVVATGAAVLKTLVHMLVSKLPSFQVWIFGLVPSSPGRKSLSEHSEFVGEGKESVHGLCLQFNPRLRLGVGVHFWRFEFEEPAVLILTRSGRRGTSPFRQEVVP